LGATGTGDSGSALDQATRQTASGTILTVIQDESNRPRAEAELARACQFLGELNVPTRIRVGHPSKEIIREATEGNYDLVVMGKGRNSSRRRLFGPTPTQVMEGAPCPVLIAQGQGNPIQRILLCDSGATGEPVLSYFTRQLTELLDGEEEITVLHVMSQIAASPGVQGKQLRAAAEDLIEEHSPEGSLLERDVQMLDRPGIHPHPKVRHGLVVNEILAEAQSGDYDLVVIGAHQSQGWWRFLLDDLASKIVDGLDRPVLVVR